MPRSTHCSSVRGCATSKLYAQMDQRALEAPQEGWRQARQRCSPRLPSHCNPDSTMTMPRLRRSRLWPRQNGHRNQPPFQSGRAAVPEPAPEPPAELSPAPEPVAEPASSDAEPGPRTSRRRRSRGRRGGTRQRPSRRCGNDRASAEEALLRKHRREHWLWKTPRRCSLRRQFEPRRLPHHPCLVSNASRTPQNRAGSSARQQGNGCAGDRVAGLGERVRGLSVTIYIRCRAICCASCCSTTRRSKRFRISCSPTCDRC